MHTKWNSGGGLFGPIAAPSESISSKNHGPNMAYAGAPLRHHHLLRQPSPWPSHRPDYVSRRDAANFAHAHGTGCRLPACSDASTPSILRRIHEEQVSMLRPMCRRAYTVLKNKHLLLAVYARNLLSTRAATFNHGGDSSGRAPGLHAYPCHLSSGPLVASFSASSGWKEVTPDNHIKNKRHACLRGPGPHGGRLGG